MCVLIENHFHVVPCDATHGTQVSLGPLSCQIREPLLPFSLSSPMSDMRALFVSLSLRYCWEGGKEVREAEAMTQKHSKRVMWVAGGKLP